MTFEFATAARIIFGPGTLSQIAPLVSSVGRRPLIVTGRDPTRAARLLDLLGSAKIPTAIFAILHEPTTDDIMRGVEHARATNCDCVIGFGGGSTIDAAKAIAALLTNHRDLFDYLEVVGRAQPLEHPAAPSIAIPTTAGTGAEVTRNAVLAVPTHRVKVSLRSPHMLPQVALVDPELTYGVPSSISAATGLDALTQLIEPYVSARANPLVDAICAEGLKRAARSLQTVVENPEDVAAREDMALASLYGGLALANAGLGAVHGFAGPIGGMFAAPHGAVCAALLPHVMEFNLRALRARTPTADALRRFDELAGWLTGRADASADEGVNWVRALVQRLPIPSLASHGLSSADIPAIVAASAKASSMKANPLPLTASELTEILTRAL